MKGTGRIYKRGTIWWVDYSYWGKCYRESSESDRRERVPGAGFEPARDCSRGILSPLRLPVSPPRQY